MRVQVPTFSLIILLSIASTACKTVDTKYHRQGSEQSEQTSESDSSESSDYIGSEANPKTMTHLELRTAKPVIGVLSVSKV